MPTISFATLDDCADATGTVVVIDVLRAFTTAAVALHRGAARIELVADAGEAFARRREDPALLLAGEVDGRPVPGFDLSNSPVAMAAADVAGRTLVMRTTAGTQGVVRARRADRLLATSFAVASATARAIADDPAVTFVVTGAHSGLDGDEDRACADLIVAQLAAGGPVDPAAHVARVRASDAGRLFLDDDTQPWFDPADLEHAVVVDRFDFAMGVQRADGRAWLVPLAAPSLPAERDDGVEAAGAAGGEHAEGDPDQQ